MDGFKVRRATQADVHLIEDISRLAYAKWVKVIGREPLPMTADYKTAVKEHLIDLWEENGQLVALIETINADDHLFVENIAVHPDYQNTGRGGILLDYAEMLAEKLGHREVQLLTNEAFVSNIEFYSKRGYEETKRKEIRAGSFAIYMRKQLPPTIS